MVICTERSLIKINYKTYILMVIKAEKKEKKTPQ